MNPAGSILLGAVVDVLCAVQSDALPCLTNWMGWDNFPAIQPLQQACYTETILLQTWPKCVLQLAQHGHSEVVENWIKKVGISFLISRKLNVEGDTGAGWLGRWLCTCAIWKANPTCPDSCLLIVLHTGMCCAVGNPHVGNLCLFMQSSIWPLAMMLQRWPISSHASRGTSGGTQVHACKQLTHSSYRPAASLQP